MGCWNSTCGISNVAITEGDDIVGLLVVQNKTGEASPGGSVYHTDIWQPMFLPIRGKYDDYGGIGDIVEDWNTQYIMSTLREVVQAMPEGENKYHEQEVDPGKLDLYNIQVFIRSGRLNMISSLRWGGQMPSCSQIGIIHIHGRVWDELAGRRIKGYKRTTSADSMISKSSDALTACLKRLQEGSEEMNQLMEKIHWDSRVRELDLIHCISNHCVPALTNIIKGCYYDGKLDIDRLNEVLPPFANLAMVSLQVDALRKPWMPQCGQGSQDDDQTTMRFLYTTIKKVYKARKEEYEY